MKKRYTLVTSTLATYTRGHAPRLTDEEKRPALVAGRFSIGAQVQQREVARIVILREAKPSEESVFLSGSREESYGFFGLRPQNDDVGRHFSLQY